MVGDGDCLAYSGSPVCPHCAGDPVSLQSAPRWGRFWAWFVDGSRGPKTEASCPNGHRWSYGPFTPAYTSRLGRLWSAVAYNRTVIPTPSSYASALAVGITTGVALRLISGWRYWWVTGPSAVALSLETATATAFRGPQRRATLRGLHDQLDPRGARHRRRVDHETMVTRRRFPIYGLTDPPSAPTQSGTSSSTDGVLASFVVFYGDPAVADNSYVEVETETTAAEGDEWAIEHWARGLPTWAAFHQAITAGGDRHRAIARARILAPAQEPPSWKTAIATIDDRPQTAQEISIGHATLTVVTTPDVMIAVRSLTPGNPIHLTEIEPPDVTVI